MAYSDIIHTRLRIVNTYLKKLPAKRASKPTPEPAPTLQLSLFGKPLSQKREAIQARERIKERKAKGLCACKRALIPGKNYCEACRASMLKHLASLKAEVFAAYGGKCQCPSGLCNESNPKFLSIDHIFNDGHAGAVGTKLYRWLKANGFPKDRFRLMCWNCNAGRAMNRQVCPQNNEMPITVNLYCHYLTNE
jgi:hypothetical protein